MAGYVQQQHKLSQRRACRPVRIDRTSARYQSRRKPQSELQKRLRLLAEQRPRFGYRRLTVLLRRQGLKVNHKRIYRLYRLEE